MCPMWRSILSIAVLSAFVVLPQAAWGGIITVPVPDLLGAYDCRCAFSDSKFPLLDSRETVVEFPGDWGNIHDPAKIRLVVRGILTPGLVRGDGITRAAQEAVLMGSWSAGFFGPGGGVFAPMWELVSGPFTFQIEYPPGPGPCFLPSTDNPPEVCRLSLAPVISVYLVPWLLEQPDPLYGFAHWDEGLEIVTPLTATITEAYWERESLPEPATLSLLALGGLAILGRRKAAGCRRQAPGCRRVSGLFRI